MHGSYFIFHALQREILPAQSSSIRLCCLIEIKQHCLFKVLLRCLVLVLFFSIHMDPMKLKTASYKAYSLSV